MSRSTSLPEIAGEQGFFFESFDPRSMAEVVQAGLATWKASPGSDEKARQHAKTFSWAGTAKHYASLYETLVRSAVTGGEACHA
jgi:glycogen synthase